MTKSGKQSAVVIFPGRGTYGKEELGYLNRFHNDKTTLIETVDAWRSANNRIRISELDAVKAYAAGRHATSENASALIYACALADFADINRDMFDIVAVCGNSLGWYLTLAGAGALSPGNAIRLVDTMGALMERDGRGGQIVYPYVDEDWRISAAHEQTITRALAKANAEGEAYLSIRLGGMAVLAGDDAGLNALENELPNAEDRYPFRLARHAAFHTPLLDHVSAEAMQILGPDLFSPPTMPMIDGRGAIWSPHATQVDALWRYTLGHQITETYDFSKSIEVALKEFAPDRLILVGPGSTLGAPIAQEMIRHRWLGLTSKAAFSDRQKTDPFLLAMGRPDQRRLVTHKD